MKTENLFRAALAFVVGAALLGATGCQCWRRGDGNGYAIGQDIITVARSRPELGTFVAAVQAAGLEGTLREEGPFTVFAPTDEAFDNLPAGTLESLLMRENKAELTDILTYHVVSGRVTEHEAIRAGSDMTLSGRPLSFGGTIRYAYWPTGWTGPQGSPVLLINGQANVVRRNIECSNGVIHIIDTVLQP